MAILVIIGSTLKDIKQQMHVYYCTFFALLYKHITNLAKGGTNRHHLPEVKHALMIESANPPLHWYATRSTLLIRILSEIDTIIQSISPIDSIVH